MIGKIFLCVAVLAGISSVQTARADALSPIGISIFPPIMFPPEDVSVTGVRVNVLWGNHRIVYGFDFGAGLNITQQQFKGVAQLAGLANYNQGVATAVGAQIAGITNININTATIVGVQAAAAVNYNATASTLVGVGVSLLNLTEHTDVYGAQVGLFNSAHDVYGVQIGVVNIADSLRGIQLGLVNVNRKGLFSVCPLINFGW